MMQNELNLSSLDLQKIKKCNLSEQIILKVFSVKYLKMNSKLNVFSIKTLKNMTEQEK